MKKRIFIALTLSKELQGKILKWEKRYRKLPVRWLIGKNLHITLIPPWYEENVSGAKKSLRRIRGSAPSFEVEFQKVSYGPDPRHPRLMWAIGSPKTELASLKSELGKIFKKKSKDDSFLLHLTLARFRPKDFVNFQVKKLSEKVSWKSRVNSVVLLESHLSRSGADYEILERVKLQ